MKPTTVSFATAARPGTIAASALAAVPCKRCRREIFGNAMARSLFETDRRSPAAGRPKRPCVVSQSPCQRRKRACYVRRIVRGFACHAGRGSGAGTREKISVFTCRFLRTVDAFLDRLVAYMSSLVAQDLGACSPIGQRDM